MPARDPDDFVNSRFAEFTPAADSFRSNNLICFFPMHLAFEALKFDLCRRAVERTPVMTYDNLHQVRTREYDTDIWLLSGCTAQLIHQFLYVPFITLTVALQQLVEFIKNEDDMGKPI